MLDDFKNMFRHLRVYLFGKGILTLAVFGAVAVASAMGASVLWPAMVIGGGGFLLTAADRLYRQSLYEKDMVELYRDNIAEQLGIAPEKVTTTELKKAAKENDVIAQALKRQRQKTILEISTAGVAGLVSIGLIAGFNMGEVLNGFAEKTLVGMLEPLAAFVGIGTVAGITSLVLNDVIGTAIGHGTGINKAAAHDLVARLDHDIKRGRAVAREDVYAVVVAANAELGKRIEKEYGKPYTSLTRARQAQVLHDVGLAGIMDQFAQAITNKQIRAGYMAFITNDPRMNTLPEQKFATPENEPVRANFVERLGLSHKNEMSHTQRVQQERTTGQAAGHSPIL